MNATYPEKVAKELRRLARRVRRSEVELNVLRGNSPRAPRSNAFIDALCQNRADASRLLGYARAVAAYMPGVYETRVIEDAYKLADEYDRAEAIA